MGQSFGTSTEELPTVETVLTCKGVLPKVGETSARHFAKLYAFIVQGVVGLAPDYRVCRPTFLQFAPSLHADQPSEAAWHFRGIAGLSCGNY